jgi:GDP-4-dehydro-6-deoxy-D-mannose reductase
VAADLERPEEITSAIEAIRPDRVIHAAGRTPPATRDELLRSNAWGTLRLLEALISARSSARLVITGSAAELGRVGEEHLPVGEDYPPQPSDDYGFSKWAATHAAQTLFRRIDVVIARIFNPVGPGQPKTQALGAFASELAAGATSLFVGDLEARRDFVDVRDVARALVILGQAGGRGRVYHVGTGQSHRVGDALEHFLKCVGRTVEIRIDPRLASAPGPRNSRADIRRITAETSWRPQIVWERSLDDLWKEATAAAHRPRLDSPGVS